MRKHSTESKFNKRIIYPNATYREFVFNREWEKYKSKEYWDYRKKWEEIPKKLEVLKFPLSLDIETTTVCNLKCPMCPRTNMIKKGLPFLVANMDFDFYRSVIDQGAKYGLPSIKLMYLGEPLSHPDIIRQIKYAKEKGIIDVIMNTNATLLIPEMAEKILDAGVDRIFFSFDSVDPEKYEKIRVGAKFKNVVKNIQYLYKLKNKKYPHVQTRASTVLMRGNGSKDEFEKYKDFWKDTIDTVSCGVCVEPFPDENHLEYEGFICAQLWQRMFVRVDGQITVCCSDYTKQYVVGNAKKEKLYDIWHNDKYEFIRNKHKTGNYYDIEMCRRCEDPYNIEKMENERK